MAKTKVTVKRNYNVRLLEMSDGTFRLGFVSTLYKAPKTKLADGRVLQGHEWRNVPDTVRRRLANKLAFAGLE